MVANETSQLFSTTQGLKTSQKQQTQKKTEREVYQSLQKMKFSVITFLLRINYITARWILLFNNLTSKNQQI